MQSSFLIALGLISFVRYIIFSTHITSDLDKIADYIAVVSEGELVIMEEKDKLLSEYALVQISKNAMTAQISEKLVGIKENAFGYIGLTKNKEDFVESDSIKLKRPTVEDLIVYGDKYE